MAWAGLAKSQIIGSRALPKAKWLLLFSSCSRSSEQNVSYQSAFSPLDSVADGPYYSTSSICYAMVNNKWQLKLSSQSFW